MHRTARHGSHANLAVEDFSPLGGLTRLSVLNLGENWLENISLPQDLTGLTDLDLSSNNLTTLTLFDGLTNLTSLDLSWNQLSDFVFLEELPNIPNCRVLLHFSQLYLRPLGLDAATYKAKQ